MARVLGFLPRVQPLHAWGGGHFSLGMGAFSLCTQLGPYVGSPLFPIARVRVFGVRVPMVDRPSSHLRV